MVIFSVFVNLCGDLPNSRLVDKIPKRFHEQVRRKSLLSKMVVDLNPVEGRFLIDRPHSFFDGFIGPRINADVKSGDRVSVRLHQDEIKCLVE